MTKRLGRAALSLIFLGAVALAEEPKVEVMADVVLASNKGTKVDPELEEMKKTFAEKNFNFSSWERQGRQRLGLHLKKAEEVVLPNKKKATLTLQGVTDGVAQIKISLPPSNTEYQLGREGKLYIDGGKHQGGQLWLVIAPTVEAKPRRLEGQSRPLPQGATMLPAPADASAAPAPK